MLMAKIMRVKFNCCCSIVETVNNQSNLKAEEKNAFLHVLSNRKITLFNETYAIVIFCVAGIHSAV